MKIKNKLLLIFISALFILHSLFSLSQSFSEFYILKIAPFFRVPLSFISSFFPFSLFESVIIIITIFTFAALISWLVGVILKAFTKSESSYFKSYIDLTLKSVLVIFALFVLVFDASYSRVPVGKSMELQDLEMNEENVERALSVAIDNLAMLEGEIPHKRGLPTSHSLDFKTLSKSIAKSAEKASERYDFLQKNPFPTKPLALSRPLAYTGISGIFGFFTGEGNINTSFADYTLPFTMAHETSHQLGVGSEKEAEFSAFLICLESELPYVRYSAWSQVAITLLNLLFEYDEDSFYEALATMPSYALTDIIISAESFEEYSKTYADEAASVMNNLYLMSNGDEGVVSYSLSSRLFVSYILEKEEYLREN